MAKHRIIGPGGEVAREVASVDHVGEAAGGLPPGDYAVERVVMVPRWESAGFGVTVRPRTDGAAAADGPQDDRAWNDGPGSEDA